MVRTCIKDNVVNFAENIRDYLICSDSLNETLFSLIFTNQKDIATFLDALKIIKQQLLDDLDFFIVCDPACTCKDEVIECYPGYKAITYYRLAHELFKLNYRLEARIISEEAHFLTGIDIHPGASIASPVFIDHGTGIVIGETSIIGHHVKLYQGVTLGALSLAKGALIKGQKRHPTIGNYVTIYANASILGGDVTIGDNVVIGGNVFLLESIPSNYKVIINKPKLILIKK